MDKNEDFKRYCNICKVPNDVKEKVLLVWEKRAIMNGETKYRHTRGFLRMAGRRFAGYQQALELGIQEGAWKSEVLQNQHVDEIEWHVDSAKQQAIINKLRTETAPFATSFITKDARDGTSLKDFMNFFAVSLQRQFKTLDYTEYLETFLTYYSNFFDERNENARRRDKVHAGHVMKEKTGMQAGTGANPSEFLLRF